MVRPENECEARSHPKIILFKFSVFLSSETKLRTAFVDVIKYSNSYNKYIQI